MWPTPKTAYLLLSAYGLLASASPIEERQSCPGVHVFGARETTVAPGYGSSSYVVNAVLAAYSGSTSEAIVYPACGGQSSCGSISYGSSVTAGVTAAANAVNSYNSKCPSTQLVLVGYSQGGQLFDDVVCQGGDSSEGIANVPALTAAAQTQVKAVILMGDPRYVSGLAYGVGTCKAGGFAARPSGFVCPQASKVQLYCDAADPYCCNGNDANTHQGYGQEYGAAALTFIKARLSASGGGSTTPAPAPTQPGTTAPAAPAPTTPSGGGSCGAKYSQCGGNGWTGATCCASGSTCQAANSYYSQCL